MRTNVLAAPFVRLPPLRITCDVSSLLSIGHTYNFQASVSGNTGAVTWSIEDPIPGFTINPTTGAITWTVEGFLSVTVRLKVVDSKGAVGARGFFVVSNMFEYNTAGQVGLYWDVNAPNALFQDDNGTIPAGVGDTVRCIKEMAGRHEYRLVMVPSSVQSGEAVVSLDAYGIKYLRLTNASGGALFKPATDIPQNAAGVQRTFSVAVAHRPWNLTGIGSNNEVPFLYTAYDAVSGSGSLRGPIVIGYRRPGNDVTVYAPFSRYVKATSTETLYFAKTTANGNVKDFNTSEPLAMHAANVSGTERPQMISAWVGVDSAGRSTNVRVYDGRIGATDTIPNDWAYTVPYFDNATLTDTPAPPSTGLVIGNRSAPQTALGVNFYRLAAISGPVSINEDAKRVFTLCQGSDGLTTYPLANPSAGQPVSAVVDATGQNISGGGGEAGQPNWRRISGGIGYAWTRGNQWISPNPILAINNCEVSQYGEWRSGTASGSGIGATLGIYLHTLDRDVVVSTWNMGPTNTYKFTASIKIYRDAGNLVYDNTFQWTDSWTP